MLSLPKHLLTPLHHIGAISKERMDILHNTITIIIIIRKTLKISTHINMAEFKDLTETNNLLETIDKISEQFNPSGQSIRHTKRIPKIVIDHNRKRDLLEKAEVQS